MGVLIRNPDYFRHIAARIQPEQFVTDLNRTIAQVIYRRLEQNLPVDMPSLSGELEPEQMSQLSRILLDASGIKSTQQETDDYIDVLLQNQNKPTPQQIGAMDDEQFREYMASLTAGKR